MGPLKTGAMHQSVGRVQDETGQDGTPMRLMQPPGQQLLPLLSRYSLRKKGRLFVYFLCEKQESVTEGRLIDLFTSEFHFHVSGGIHLFQSAMQFREAASV